jgi:hypothetical protein
MPQYLLSVFQEEGAEPPAPEHAEMIMARVAAVQEEMKAAGAWVFFGALTDASSATVVRAADGEMSMTDGPYAEAKEQIGGFTVIEAADQTRRRERRHVVDRPQPRRPQPRRPGPLSAFEGISCSSATRCLAVGGNDPGTGIRLPFSALWNGKAWTTIPVPNP